VNKELKKTSFFKAAIFNATAAIFVAAPSLFGGDADPRIAKFPGDRAAAVSLTFDDGLPDHLSIAVPALEKRGMRGTFFLVTGYIPNNAEEASNPKAHNYGKIPWPVWKELAEKGHEIGNHSMHHKQLTKLSDEDLAKEIDDAYSLIEKNIGQAPLTFCFPGNGHDERVDRAVAQRHVAGRTRLKGYGGKDFTLEKANGMVEEAIAKRDWMVVMIHGIKQGYDAFGDPDVFGAHLDFLAENSSRVAVDTFANIARYVAERDNAKLSSEKISGGVRLSISTTLDKRYSVPLTVVIPAPDAKDVKALFKDDGKPVPVKIVQGSILVDMIPDGRAADVTW
jgi:peptidoglycan/xylan/chitin deacetylase (PgdA/CDA1 family)